MVVFEGFGKICLWGLRGFWFSLWEEKYVEKRGAQFGRPAGRAAGVFASRIARLVGG